MICGRAGDKVCARAQHHHSQFKSVVRHFIREAQRLAKLDHPGIVGVHQVFEDNETAYMALDYVDGQDLLEIVQTSGRYLGPIAIKALMMQILEAVGFMHDQGLLHRDISPDNILVDRAGNPVLIDFGAARENSTEAGAVLSALLLIKEGYSPQEFYLTGSEQGPFSDLYALGATFYNIISGEIPPNSQERLAAVASNSDDPYKPIPKTILGYDRRFLTAIDRALELFPKDRFQSAYDWIDFVDTAKRAEAACAKAQGDQNIQAVISRLVAETNGNTSASDRNMTDDLGGHSRSKPRLGAISRIGSLLFGSSKRAKQDNTNEVQL